MSKVGAWIELAKLGNISYLRHDIDDFFRGNIITILQEEAWFEFLTTPRSIHDIATQFNYSDISFLQAVLDALVHDHTINYKNGKYSINKAVVSNWVKPTIFDSGISELMMDYARAVPERLRGNYKQFTSGFNLYNWDDALGKRMYNQIRKSALRYSRVPHKPVKFLDIGSGNGYGTAQIWVEFYKRGFVNGDFYLMGIEPDENLLRLSQEEIGLRIKSALSTIDDTELEKYAKFLPKFQKGNVLSLPFSDKSFDVVFASQVLHWTNAEMAVKEMLRVTKPGGIVFGTQNFYPDANRYNDLHFRVLEGANGFFSKKDFRMWARKYGAKKVKFATPISVYKIIKA